MNNYKNKKIVLIILMIVFLIFSFAFTLSKGEKEIDTGDNEKDYLENVSKFIEEIQVKNAETIDLNTIDKDVLNIKTNGIYKLTGSYLGQINIDAEVTLILENVTITNLNEPCINVTKGNELYIYNPLNTINNIKSGEDKEIVSSNDLEANYAAIYSKDNIYIYGEGLLNVEGYINNGIQSSDALILKKANINVISINHGIKANDYLLIEDSSINVKSGQDSLKTDVGDIVFNSSTINLISYGDGVSSNNNIYINSGKINIVAGGGHQENDSVNYKEPQWPMNKDFNFFDQEIKDFNNLNNENIPNDNNRFERDGNGNRPERNFDFNNDKFNNWNFDEAENSRNDFDEMMNSDSSSTKGIKAENSIFIKGGDIEIDSFDDCLHSEKDLIIEDGNIVLATNDDGMTCDANLTINGGVIDVIYSYEGIEGNILTINNGVIKVNSNDDGINAGKQNPILTINGGEIYVKANGDGFDSNGDLIINGGSIVIDGPADSRNGALDSGSENGGVLLTNGGETLAIGASGMDDCFNTESTQCFFKVNISGNEGSSIVIKDEMGNELKRHISAKSFSSIVYSSSQLKANGSYQIIVDGQINTITLDGNSYTYSSSMGTHKFFDKSISNN